MGAVINLCSKEQSYISAIFFLFIGYCKWRSPKNWSVKIRKQEARKTKRGINDRVQETIEINWHFEKAEGESKTEALSDMLQTFVLLSLGFYFVWNLTHKIVPKDVLYACKVTHITHSFTG